MFLLKLFPLYALTLWAGDDGGPGGGGTSTGEGDPPGNPPPAGGAPTGGGQPGSNGATFTQADLDRIAGQTRKEALAKWAKEHGFADVKEAEAAIKAQKEAEDKSKSNLEKAQTEAQREKAAREQAEARLTNTVLRAAFDRAAMTLVGDLDLAYLAAQNAGLLSAENGIVVDVEKNSVTGLDKVIEKLLKDKPILKKVSQASPAGTGGAEGGSSSTTSPTQEQDNQARRTYGIRPQRG